jgi:hypothetical protein
MKPDDLLCSRNARPQKALVGRAQWEIKQLPSLEITSGLGRVIDKIVGVRCVQCKERLAQPAVYKKQTKPFPRMSKALE